MNIKFTGLVLGTALSAFAFTGCQNAAVNTNANANTTRVNNNTAVVVNANNNSVVATTNTNTTGSTNANNWNANINRADWEKNKDEYANRAKSAGSTIGQGANDLWIWTKARTALATTEDLRDSTINVDVDNGVVTLKGTVANQAQKTKAGQVAKVEDAKSVNNQLTVAAGDSIVNTGGGNTGNTNANRR